ncbi:unnamed protein product [Agarophyton chilense]|eukprot:gb/GEZJ01004981.1/.p2 GENE.gb/GEZJ01004981.1/~~gb/GEZJ01004981.1/.p2  ORF type:complete len:314 (-),score=62.26 gb/GEZJ01004981.1/:896-1837(-)
MSAKAKLSTVASDLHSLFVNLASACLKEEPLDVEQFCLRWLASRHGLDLESELVVTRVHSVDSEDVKKLKSKKTRNRGRKTVKKSGIAEEYTTDENNGRSDIFHSDGDSRGSESDDEQLGRVKTVSEDAQLNAPSCSLFSTAVISDQELERKTELYRNDERMKSLFRAWDGDGSGKVDFVELVLALHKFEDVASAGIDIQVASDALVQFVESDTERELNLSEFTRVIILFALNNFHADFDSVADHMLKVATSTSEAAVLRAACGADVSDLQAADKEEQEFLRETVMGMEQHVTDNIQKLREQRTPRGSQPFGN